MRVEFRTPNGRPVRVPESLVDRYAAAGWSRVEPEPESVPEPDEKPRPVKRSRRKSSSN